MRQNSALKKVDDNRKTFDDAAEVVFYFRHYAVFQYPFEREAWRQERDIWTETLQKFSEKYDVIIADLREIKAKITGKE
jgi:ABC-type transporter lipoprotein component MlaA